MIKFMKKWCEGIIVGVMISVIIELIIPEGNNKKYVKVISGIFIIYTVLNPIFQNLNFDFEKTFDEIFSSSIEASTTDVSVNNEIKDVYVLGIENDIKEFLKENGYSIEKVNVKLDLNYEEIISLEIKIKDLENLEIAPKIEKKDIVISENKEIINENEIVKKDNKDNKIKNIIFEEYKIEENKITIYR